MIDNYLLQSLRNAAELYQLPNNFRIIRPINEIDGIGGIKATEKIIATVKGRLVAKIMSEEQEGGGIIGNNKFELIMPSNVDIRIDDKVKLVDDNNKNRYYSIINTDSNSSEGLFTTSDVIERYS